MEPRSRREEYSEATRAALVEAARAHFARDGYADTSIDDITRAARVTKGALYHHFKDKRELFEAVVRQVQQEIAGQVRATAVRERDPWQRFVAGVDAFLTNSAGSDGRITLEDAISVLGWQRWREIDAEYALGGLIAALESLVAAGLLRPVRVEVLTHLLMAAFTEAALLIGSATDREAAARETRDTILAMVAPLRPK